MHFLKKCKLTWLIVSERRQLALGPLRKEDNMGILTRFKDIMSSNINALLDKAEDPEKMLDQYLRNLNNDLGKVKSETAAVMASEAKAKRELDASNEEIDKLQRYAAKAVEAGNDEDAKKFLEKKLALQADQPALQQSFDTAHNNAENMKAMNKKLTADIASLEERKSVLKNKINMAKTQEHINDMNSSVGSANNSIDAFKRMEAKADQMIDQANAKAQLNAESTAAEETIDSLVSKYDGTSDNSADNAAAVDAELAALKASMN